MSWRTVVITRSAKLDYQLGYLIVRKDDVKKIHISEIAVLIIESTAVSLTGVLISELTKQGVKVIFCDEKQNPSSEIVPYYGSHDTSKKLSEQIHWAESVKEAVSTRILIDKIKQQAFLLSSLGLDPEQKVLSFAKEMMPGDPSNREAHAARVYFPLVFGSHFIRSSDTSTNFALDYGYSVLLAAFNREISASGYITQLGLSHRNAFNKFNFASDLMEPFRPIVDYMVYCLDPDSFGSDEKHYILTIFKETVEIDGKKENLTNAIGIYSRSVFEALNKGSAEHVKSIIPQYEL